MRNATKALLVGTLVATMLILGVAAAVFVPKLLQADQTPTQDSPDALVAHTWNQTEAPNYYTVQGPASFCLGTALEEGVRYQELDVLGRASGVQAVVTLDMVQEGTARPREDMSSLTPSGWGSNEEVSIPLPNGGTYNGYFWNRSHLLAKSLGGEEDLRNLITGTRMQNVGANDSQGGMAYCETLSRDWLEQNPQGTIRYEAVPVYEGWEQVPRSVYVSMLSSDGTLDQQVEVFNAAWGYRIDYATGTFELEQWSNH